MSAATVKERVEPIRRADRQSMDRQATAIVRNRGRVITRESPPASLPARDVPPPAKALKPPSAPSTLEPIRGQSPRRLRAFLDHQPLARLFVMFGVVVATTLMMIFGCDLIFAWPFQRASTTFDVTTLVCAFGLTFLCWDAHQSLK